MSNAPEAHKHKNMNPMFWHFGNTVHIRERLRIAIFSSTSVLVQNEIRMVFFSQYYHHCCLKYYTSTTAKAVRRKHSFQGKYLKLFFSSKVFQETGIRFLTPVL